MKENLTMEVVQDIKALLPVNKKSENKFLQRLVSIADDWYENGITPSDFIKFKRNGVTLNKIISEYSNDLLSLRFKIISRDEKKWHEDMEKTQKIIFWVLSEDESGCILIEESETVPDLPEDEYLVVSYYESTIEIVDERVATFPKRVFHENVGELCISGLVNKTQSEGSDLLIEIFFYTNKKNYMKIKGCTMQDAFTLVSLMNHYGENKMIQLLELDDDFLYDLLMTEDYTHIVNEIDEYFEVSLKHEEIN